MTMPRFHFNAVSGDRITPDLEGEELLDADAARKEAVASAREILANAIRTGSDAPERIQVIDGHGCEVLSVSLADLLPMSLRNK